MLHRLPRADLVLAATAALTLPAVATPTAPGPTEREPSPRWAEITRIPGGFRYLASLHDSNLTIRRDAGRVVFHDRAMRRFREALPNGCRRVTVEVGIAASCLIPATATAGGGAGADRIVSGDGSDELSGNEGDDVLEGGPGNDLLLGGAGSDSLLCGDGTDTSDDNAADDDTSRHCELQAP